MKSMLASLMFALALAPAVAHADDMTQRKGTFGVAFEFLPSGTISWSGSLFGVSGSGSQSADVAYGIDVIADTEVNDLVSIGIAPRFLFNVIGKNDNGDASSQIDLRARVAVGHELIPKLRIYGFAEPGYSIIFPPDSNNNNQKVHPNGFVIAVGGGAAIHFTPKIAATFELGYQWGFQTWSATVLGQDTSGDYKDEYLTLGFGVATTFD